LHPPLPIPDATFPERDGGKGWLIKFQTEQAVDLAIKKADVLMEHLAKRRLLHKTINKGIWYQLAINDIVRESNSTNT